MREPKPIDEQFKHPPFSGIPENTPKEILRDLTAKQKSDRKAFKQSQKSERADWIKNAKGVKARSDKARKCIAKLKRAFEAREASLFDIGDGAIDLLRQNVQMNYSEADTLRRMKICGGPTKGSFATGDAINEKVLPKIVEFVWGYEKTSYYTGLDLSREFTKTSRDLKSLTVTDHENILRSVKRLRRKGWLKGDYSATDAVKLIAQKRIEAVRDKKSLGRSAVEVIVIEHFCHPSHLAEATKVETPKPPKPKSPEIPAHSVNLFEINRLRGVSVLKSIDGKLSQPAMGATTLPEGIYAIFRLPREYDAKVLEKFAADLGCDPLPTTSPPRIEPSPFGEDASIERPAKSGANEQLMTRSECYHLLAKAGIEPHGYNGFWLVQTHEVILGSDEMYLRLGEEDYAWEQFRDDIIAASKDRSKLQPFKDWYERHQQQPEPTAEQRSSERLIGPAITKPAKDSALANVASKMSSQGEYNNHKSLVSRKLRKRWANLRKVQQPNPTSAPDTTPENAEEKASEVDVAKS